MPQIRIVVRVGLLVLAAFLAPVMAVAGPSGLVRVVDADTIRVGGETVRLFGIDAPEIGQPCRRNGETFDCGRWAAAAVADAFSGRRAECDDRGLDRYGRTIAKCTVDGQDMGATIVLSGLAEAFRRYSDDYIGVEKEAVFQGRGIWSVEMARPSDFRDTGVTSASGAPSGGCAIKGNISSNGRIYHLPGQEHYAKTRISTAKGERWFCTEAEARAAGWRRARR